MRILLPVHQYLPRKVGGTEVYTWSLAQALAARGHTVTVFYPDTTVTADTREELGQHAVWRAPAAPAPGLAGPLGIFWRTFRNPSVEHSYRRALAELRPEVVHVQHVQEGSARILALTGSIPLLITLHDFWFRCAVANLVRPDGSRCEGPSVACADCLLARAHARVPRWMRPLVAVPAAYRNLYLTWMLTYAERIITPSAFVRQRFMDWGVDGARLAVVPNGLDASRLQAGAPTVSSIPGTPGRRFGYLGSVAPIKGLHVALRAFEGLPEDATLSIYGDTALFPTYVQQLKEGVRHPGVRFMDRLPAEAVGAALRQLDYLIVPSLADESYSMVVDEAQALGVPVIASALGALARIRDGVDGRLFPAGDAAGLHAILKELVERPDLHQRYVRALPRVPLLSEQAALLEGMYSALLSQGHSARRR
ncbi:MAG: glycosyltransferase family 4 protein [Anaerolineae bacterium]|nr:glycosyltransferase family 4 protein [Chloroflexota bacterium]